MLGFVGRVRWLVETQVSVSKAFPPPVILITGGGKGLDTETCISTSQRALPTKHNSCEMELHQSQGAPRPSCSTIYDLFGMCTFLFMFNLLTVTCYTIMITYIIIIIIIIIINVITCICLY